MPLYITKHMVWNAIRATMVVIMLVMSVGVLAGMVSSHSAESLYGQIDSRRPPLDTSVPMLPHAGTHTWWDGAQFQTCDECPVPEMCPECYNLSLKAGPKYQK